MKWFQHQTDASDDIKIKRLEDKFGLMGYSVFFKIVEKVGKEGKKYALDTKKYPIEFFAKDFGVEKKVLEDCLTFMNDLGLVVFKSGIISLPNMKKYASNWDRRKSRATTEQLRSNDGVTTAQEEKRRDKIRKEEKRVFSSSKKPYYKRTGEEMRLSKGKWWVIPKNGGQWLEFADKESEIIFK